MTFVEYVRENTNTLLFYAQQHFQLVLISVGAATLIGVTLGLVLQTSGLAPRGWAYRLRTGLQETSLLLAAAALTVPSLALLTLLQGFFGLGLTTSVVGLTIYALYPVLRNTVAGLASVDPAVMESAQGLGMGRTRRLFRVQLPLAWPVILSGIRVAVLIIVSIAVVVALVQGPGFGQLVLSGLSRYGAAGAFYDVVAGTFGCLVVAAAFEIAFAVVQRFTVPRGIR